MALAGVSVAATGCTPTHAGTLTMAAGEPGGTYIRFGQRLAEVVTESGIAERMVALETEGSIHNLDLLRSGGADIAIALADAVQGRSDGLVALGRVYQNYLQCIVPADVADIGHLDGEVSIGAPGSGTALTARRVLEALGLTVRGRLRPVELRLSDAIDRLGDGTLAAVFWSGGVPLPELDRLHGVRATTVLDLTAALDRLSVRHPRVYQPTAIPAGVYGLTDDLPAIGVPNLLLAREDLPDDLAVALVDRLIDDAPRLVPDRSVGVQFLTPSNLIDTAIVALHPAAQRRFRARYG